MALFAFVTGTNAKLPANFIKISEVIEVATCTQFGEET